MNMRYRPGDSGLCWEEVAEDPKIGAVVESHPCAKKGARMGHLQSWNSHPFSELLVTVQFESVKDSFWLNACDSRLRHEPAVDRDQSLACTRQGERSTPTLH